MGWAKVPNGYCFQVCFFIDLKIQTCSCYLRGIWVCLTLYPVFHCWCFRLVGIATVICVILRHYLLFVGERRRTSSCSCMYSCWNSKRSFLVFCLALAFFFMAFCSSKGPSRQWDIKKGCSIACQTSIFCFKYYFDMMLRMMEVDRQQKWVLPWPYQFLSRQKL